MRHSPRKRFGQNFLENQQIIESIIRAINPQSTDNILEIGPGLGALTKPLMKHLSHLTVVEIDRDLQKNLATLPNSSEKLNIIGGDALDMDYSQFGKQLRVVGNLPYNISTPILLHLLAYCSSIKDMYFMLQKEVVDRMVAIPGTKAYGRLSVILQYHCSVDHLFDVSPNSFNPPPKVQSAMVRLIPHDVNPYPEVAVKELEKLVAKAFAMRRKTLNNNLKELISSEQLSAIGIDGSKRPEQISIAEYVQLAKFISK